MVIPVPGHVAAIATDIEIFWAWARRPGYPRHMCLHEAAMPLCYNLGQFAPLQWDVQVQPVRHFRDRQCLGAFEDQQRDYLLNTGRAGIGVGRVSDVVVEKVGIIPNRRIEMMFVELAPFLGPRGVGAAYNSSYGYLTCLEPVLRFFTVILVVFLGDD